MTDLTTEQLKAIAAVANSEANPDRRPCFAIIESCGLPELAGSDKQVKWATTIRSGKICDAIEEMGRSEKAKGRKIDYMRAAAKFVAEASTEACWWIDNKATTAAQMLRDMASPK
jgi:hypothetical protein